MTIRKLEVLELLNQFPHDIDIEEVIYRLYLREKLIAAEADISASRTVSVEELRQQIATWRR